MASKPQQTSDIGFNPSSSNNLSLEPGGYPPGSSLFGINERFSKTVIYPADSRPENLSYRSGPPYALLNRQGKGRERVQGYPDGTPGTTRPRKVLFRFRFRTVNRYVALRECGRTTREECQAPPLSYRVIRAASSSPPIRDITQKQNDR